MKRQIRRNVFETNSSSMHSLTVMKRDDKYTPEEFLRGINIELEHGTIDSKTNVTNDNLITTAKIALAHLNEFSNYYNKDYGLLAFEEFLK